MAQSWRIKTLEFDRTDRATTDTTIVGASVIVSPKGPKTFTKFNQGDTQGVLDVFGYPSKDYPSIQDALDIVQKCTMYFASPYKGGTYGGVFVTKSMGSVPFSVGVNEKEIEDYSKVPFADRVSVADGTTLTYTYTVPRVAKYVAESMKILIDGTQYEDLTISTSEGVETFTDTGASPIFDSGCTFNTADGTLTLVTLTPFAEGTELSITYDMDMSDTYFVLFDKDMQEDDVSVQVVLSEDTDDAFEITVSRFDPVSLTNVTVNGSPFLVGLSETSRNTYGDNIYIENIFGDRQTLFDAHVVKSVIDGFTDDTKLVKLNGGSRGDTPDGADVAKLYDQLMDTSKYQLKFCVDGTCNPEVVAKYESLRNNYQKRCRFVYPTADVTGDEIVKSPTTYNYGVTANRGLYQYCMTWGIHQDLYQGNNFKCSNMGLVAGRIVDALNAGTGCPAWIDENGVGGILGSSILRLSKEGSSEDVLHQLDDLCFNPVVYDYYYGAMIVGWRTRQVKKTIYSNIPQSSLADLMVEQIEKQILPSRIGKLIDESSYTTVRNGVTSIVSSYAQFLEDYYVWCDSNNNTAETRNREELIVQVGIVFKNYARMVILTFTAYNNGVNVQEEMMK